ncbi:N-acetyltransferase [Corallococcus sp. AB004]|uniref:N-acetyltransferase n=2 Tax=Corallococcus TaxID=83461 RepID=UPI000EA2B05A|nr:MULTISPECIES: N-acetyltransferase [Corallococcus]RKI36950.1 N-acetyltransferase [Corallococcus sp. AB004]NNC19096.1 N-acetyltransferase [Corallococcus exiguus]NPC73608.1 N-acetyltransferase [Corallococcus exiguus]NPD27705.1 N-acetyltransferase [Corallococcus exiguus]NRD48206.1 N-acetyltransferase [Corallococcus exiguus]
MAHPAKHEDASASPTPMTTDVQVTPVRGAADRTAFIRLPYSLYRDDPNWVPPLEMERRDFLDPKKNPFFDYAEVELFLARRGQDVVGRVAAIKNPRHMEFHGTKEGFFGLFECVNDAGVARGLLDAASAWLKARGIDSVLGPANFSSNQDWGLLVEGYESPPALMMPYNPTYYAGLLETCGFTKAKDLFAFELSASTPPPEKVARIAEKIRQREGVTVRAVNLKDFPAEVARIKQIYNAAWEKNWGFIPFTDREFEHMAKEMKAIVRPELVLIAEVKGEPVAFSMTLPDANEAFKAANGRLTTFGLPIGLVKLVLASRKLKRLRLLTLGIKEGYRRRGLDAILYLDTLRNAKELGYTGGEISWTLEDNHLVNRAIESMGGQRSKTYRVFQRPV